MGIEYNAVRSFLVLKGLNKNFGKIATIGRQGFDIPKKQLVRIFKSLDYPIKDADLQKMYSSRYSESFLKYLGFEQIDSFDNSDYEHATVVHDFNTEIPEVYKNSYDVVLDGGTLEHIFNFPTAIKNCMEIVRPNGYFISVTICNNFSGHGFYQFSPELFFRIFEEKNGFELMGIYLSENDVWYRVTDPALIHERVTFTNKKPTFLVVIAKKIEQKRIFAEIPQQSDYVSLWLNQSKVQIMTIWQKVKRKIVYLYRRVFIKYDGRFFLRTKE